MSEGREPSLTPKNMAGARPEKRGESRIPVRREPAFKNRWEPEPGLRREPGVTRRELRPGPGYLSGGSRYDEKGGS